MAGFRELLAVEWDDNAVQTLRLNFPHLDVYHGDIAKLSVDEVLRRTGIKPGTLDVFDGSPPCQGFSTAGKRDMGDERNQLFREYVRLLRGLKPKAFVMENVSGMVKGKMKLIFVEILRELKASGYRVSARLLNAMHYGVPQSRERMIFIGVRENLGVEPSHPSGKMDIVTSSMALTGVRHEIEAPIASALKQRRWAETALGGNHSERFSLAKLHPLRPAPTIQKTATGSTGLMHWSAPRELSSGELKRLGSWPDQYRMAGKWQDRLERIGNSVPPLLMRAIAQHIRTHILDRISP